MYRRILKMTKKAFSSYSNPGSPIQTLYDLCKNTFTLPGVSPAPPQAIQKLCSVLDTIGPADVGLKDEKQEDDRGHGFSGFNAFDRAGRWAQPITYVDIHECSSFTMCIFRFPTSSVIPLHDHPGMTVLSKVLYGSLHVKGYDWVEPAQLRQSVVPEYSPASFDKLCCPPNLSSKHFNIDKVLTAPCGTSILYPKSGGNLHCFTALTPCAVLDILAPPYEEEAGRKCTYYRDYPYSSFSAAASGDGEDDDINDGNEEDFAWLAPIGTPDDLYMRPGEYRGPVLKV